MSVVLITGASRGLGLEFARQYAATGDTVIACCRNPSKATELKGLKNVQIETLDVSDAKSIAPLAAKLKSTAIDTLICNAGIYSGASQDRNARDDDESQDFGTIDATAWDRVLQTNTIAPIMVLQAFATHLANGKNAKAVVITSKMGSIAEMGGGYIAYRSSKAALNAAMVVVSHELKDKKISIAALHPGWVQTDMGGSAAPLTPPESITGMRKVIAGMTLANTGRFLGYDGNVIAW